MEIEQIEKDLVQYFTGEVQAAEPKAEWWIDIIAGLEPQQKQSFLRGLLPKTRIAWAFAVLALLLIGGTAYGATLVVNELFRNYSGHVEGTGLVQELDMSQTLGDVTVRLERAYADANGVVTGFTVSGPDERYFIKNGVITTDTGQEFPELFGMGVVPGSKTILGDWRPADRLAYMDVFDASAYTDSPLVIHLTLSVFVDSSPVPGEGESYGPFLFSFDVPFTAANVIAIEQTKEQSSVAISLDSIRITPWATIAVFRFPDEGTGLPIVSVTLPDGTVHPESFGRSPGKDTPEYVSYFTEDFTVQSGQWTVTINELVLPPDGGARERLAGPWTFTFNIP